MIGRYKSPFGHIVFEIRQGKLVGMGFDESPTKIDSHPDIEQMYAKLNDYFAHALKQFDIPVSFEKGTPFQQSVWKAMLTIPYGKTKSYSDIATDIGHPKAIRAVGQACKKNPIGIVVPCHRVIGKDGSMTGYSGKSFIGLKRKLLEHEGVIHKKESL